MTFFLGIDSGLRNTGWGIIKKYGAKLTYIASGVIKTKADNQQDIYKSDALALKKIYDMINNVIMQYQPIHSAIENTYINNNPISSIKLAQARAVAILACSNNNMIPREYQASTIKKVVTGKGNADKIEVNKMIILQLGNIQTETTDESDAIATAMCDALSN
jgi:crossover junction endodeoxyribonuclease RuvC